MSFTYSLSAAFFCYCLKYKEELKKKSLLLDLNWQQWKAEMKYDNSDDDGAEERHGNLSSVNYGMRETAVFLCLKPCLFWTTLCGVSEPNVHLPLSLPYTVFYFYYSYYSFFSSSEKTPRCWSVECAWKTLETTLVWLKTQLDKKTSQVLSACTSVSI